MVHHRASTRGHPPLIARLAGLLLAGVVALTSSTAFADMQGMDVSGWQPANVTCAVQQYDFAIVKVTEGTGFINASWQTQAACVTGRGKALGLYHYADGGNAVAEADFFTRTARSYIGKAALFLDWEKDNNVSWGDGTWVSAFVNRVHATTGVWPLVYVQASALGQIPSSVREHCGLWVAQYASNAATGYQSAPWLYGRYGEAMRQYSSNGRLAGYSGPLDLDVFRGDRTAWEAYANPAGAAKPTNPVTPSNPSTGETITSKPDYEAMATAVIRGDYGNNPQRKTALGVHYAAVMAIVNQRLNASSGTTTQQQTTTQTTTTRVTVRSGDTLSAIATRTGLWPLSAWSVPSGNRNLIYPGQVVVYNSSATGVGTTTSARTVTVRSGDTLSGIAARLGISWTQLTGYRSGNPALIYPGEVLHY